ncbi:MAG: dUTP diphosphatase [Bacillota bacterium]
MTSEINLGVKVVTPGARAPRYATPGSAGLDLAACMEHPLELGAGEIVLVPTGIAVQIPRRDYAGLVFARSGLASRHGVALANGVGVIDSDYTGEIMVTLINNGTGPYIVRPGDRIAQLVLVPVGIARVNLVEDLQNTSRGDGGFGSTGK